MVHIKKKTNYYYICVGLFIFTDFSQHNRFNAEANMKIQWSSNETDKKETCKNIKT